MPRQCLHFLEPGLPTGGILQEDWAVEIHPFGEDDARVNVIQDRRSALRRISQEQLLQLGMTYVAYLRSGLYEGKELFAVYRADGIPIVVTDDLGDAIELAAEQGLNFVAVH
jgi:hypothetical protein